MSGSMTKKSFVHLLTKQVQKGNVRLDKHAGAGFTKNSKKGGSGKWNWGDERHHLQDEMDMFALEEEEEAPAKVSASPVKTQVAPIKATKTKARVAVKKKHVGWNSEMPPAMKRARRAQSGRKPMMRVPHVMTLEKQQRAEIGEESTPAPSMGSTYEEVLMKPNTYKEELQVLVEQLTGLKSSLSTDMAKLGMKKMMPKKINMDTRRNPNINNRRHHFIGQPQAAVRCH